MLIIPSVVFRFRSCFFPNINHTSIKLLNPLAIWSHSADLVWCKHHPARSLHLAYTPTY